MTSKERITRILKHQPVDRIGLYEDFWPETRVKWQNEGHLQKDEALEDHFKFDIRVSWPFNLVADLDSEEIVEETDETKLVRDGNGALLRSWKDKVGTPEHVDFSVKDRVGWEELIRPHLVNEKVYRRRINVETSWYDRIREKMRQRKPFLLLLHPQRFRMYADSLRS